MKLNVEYLIILERKAHEAFYQLCITTQDFTRLISSDNNLSVKSHRISHKNGLSCEYEVYTGVVEGKEQRFFHLKITYDGTDAELNNFLDLLRSIKQRIHDLELVPETLWDDVSLYYSQLAYPRIHRVENLMRKLITYFMLTTVGKEWVTENLPKQLEDALEKTKRKQYIDVLHQTDFAHLGDFLFKAYPSSKVISDLYQEIQSADEVKDLNLEFLQRFVPKSNWERYFSELVECDDVYLRTRWQKLYDLRCQVAHNTIVNRGDYQEIIRLTDEISVQLEKAVVSLDKVHIPEEAREQIAETALSNINQLYGEFIQVWKEFEAILLRAGSYTFVQNINKTISPRESLNNLYKVQLIDEDLLHECNELIQFRNQIVHDSSLSVSEVVLSEYILRLRNGGKQIVERILDSSSWRDEIVSSLKALGGEATLSDLYNYVQQNTVRELTTNWKSSIRNTLQSHSSDSTMFSSGSGQDIFKKSGRGKWALR